jgi:hypothetical protein
MNPQASMPSSPPSVTTGGLGSIGPGAEARGMQAMAQQLQGYGRGDDSMLVHMTPGEVNSLQGLAMAAGGSLTINPDTGLPEAGFLSKLLPLIAGIGLNFILPGSALAIKGLSTAAQSGLMVGAGATAITGDLSKGLMAGLGAFGGASLAGGVQGALGGAQQGLSSAPSAAAPTTAVGTGGAPMSAIPAATAPVATKTGFAGALQGFGNTAKGIPLTGGVAKTGLLAKSAPLLAASGVMNSLQPTPAEYKPEKEEPGSSQYTSAPRQQIAVEPRRAPGTEFDPTNFDSSQRRYFTPSRADVIGPDGQVFIPGTNPSGMPTDPDQFASLRRGSNKYSGSGLSSSIFNDPRMFRGAEGGKVPEFQMQSGGHVFPAKAVAAYGDFDTDAGQRKLAGLGAIPIRGPGTGVSDSIPAKIDGRAPARVASGEVYFPPKAVKRLGGTDKLYAMMRNAEKAANKAKSGEKVRGLA